VSKYRWFENLKSARVKYNVRLNPEFDQANEDTMEKLYTESKKLEYLAKIFDQLGEKCRRMLSLYYYKKMPLAMIAEQMGYTPKSAKNEKYRCMQKLKALHQKNNSHENF
jgi:RNA polymerase sigma factor (sigma-70 family)